MSEQRWSDERISNAIEKHSKGYPVITIAACVKAAKEIRDDLEAKLTEYRQEHHEVVGRYAGMVNKLRADYEQRIEALQAENEALQRESARLHRIIAHLEGEEA